MENNKINSDLSRLAEELKIDVEALESRLEMTPLAAFAAQSCTNNGGCHSSAT